VKVRVHERLDAVGEAAWTALHARTRLRSPFLTWAWQREWVQAFATAARLAIWRVDECDTAPLALLPLYEAAPGLWRLIGGVDVSDYLDLVAPAGREEEAWSALLSARASSDDVWELHAVPAASPTATQLPALAGAFDLSSRVTVEERCPVLALPSSWEAYLESLPGKQRHELRRKMRRLEREASGARVTSVADPPGLDARLGDFLDLHRRSRAGKARFMDDRMAAFFRRATARLAEAGMVRLWLLDTPGGPLASFITVEWDGTVGLYNSGFDPEHAALSPGLVLLAGVIRDAIERGCRRFDFLRGEERYKYDFGPVPEDVCLVTVGPA
jgi:CelD/BcsL family acetyltransferase involved in cellulose biosynthesis